jgi:hypothetical protein
MVERASCSVPLNLVIIGTEIDRCGSGGDGTSGEIDGTSDTSRLLIKATILTSSAITDLAYAETRKRIGIQITNTIITPTHLQLSSGFRTLGLSFFFLA